MNKVFFNLSKLIFIGVMVFAMSSNGYSQKKDTIPSIFGKSGEFKLKIEQINSKDSVTTNIPDLKVLGFYVTRRVNGVVVRDWENSNKLSEKMVAKLKEEKPEIIWLEDVRIKSPAKVWSISRNVKIKVDYQQ